MRAVTWVGRRWWIAVLVLVAGLVSPTSATDLPEGRETLAGLTGVYVSVQEMKGDEERIGLALSTLQTDVEVKLRQAGIRVLAKTEWGVAPGAPQLHLHVVAVRRGEWPYVVSIFLEFYQDVLLARKPTMALRAPTWMTSSHGILGTEGLPLTREKVRDHVDEFINAYLAANPKR